jgi:type II secretory pathway predicted ATPase ExeA/peptidoglycan hydrolase-like protein with peptidoglycan-binding domain
MYHEFFGITENPFSITPDPRYLYMSKGHQEALAHLVYGVKEGGGFVLLTGEVGTGKTSVCRCLLEQLPETADVALILNPRLDEIELLASICDELGVAYPDGTRSLKVLVDLLNRHLLAVHAKGRHAVVIIDEAQNLSAGVLEQVRLLTNLETATRKLLQIILIGQPELSVLLERDEMRQLVQRITARYHLLPLNRGDTRAYIAHRLAVGGLPPGLFSPAALGAIYRRSHGVPRLINSLCDRCLLGAYVQDRKAVGSRMVRRAAREVLGGNADRRGWSVAALPWLAASAVLAAALAITDPADLGLLSGVADLKGDVESLLFDRSEASSNGDAEVAEAVTRDTKPVEFVTEESPGATGPGDTGTPAQAGMQPPPTAAETAEAETAAVEVTDLGAEAETAPVEATEAQTAPIEATEPQTAPIEATEAQTAPVEATEPQTATVETTDLDAAAETAPIEAAEAETAAVETTDLVAEAEIAPIEVAAPQTAPPETAERTAATPSAETTNRPSVETAAAPPAEPPASEAGVPLDAGPPDPDTGPPDSDTGLPDPDTGIDAGLVEAAAPAGPDTGQEADADEVTGPGPDTGVRREPDGVAPEAPVQTTWLSDPASILTLGDLTMGELFTRRALPVDGESAFAVLLGLWGLEADSADGELDCTWSAGLGVKCMVGKTVWDTLVGFNRPALITLTGSNGRRANVVLTSVDADRVTLRAGAQRVVTDPRTLRALWSGEYLLLWRPPAVYHRLLAFGAQGQDVAWLEGRLAEIHGEPRTEGPTAVFDSALREKVMAFQESRGLKADGIVGTRTLIHLNTVAKDSGVPLLRPLAH